MTRPTLTMTMLGTTRSGKSTYLLGMYAILSAGLNNYFVYTKDPDQDLDLSDAWDLLCDTGELPPPTAVDQHRFYSFVFNHGITPLISIECMDYRGGAMNDRSDSAADVRMLRERLEESDSICLVLDGEQIGNWLAGDTPAHQVQRAMRVTQLSTQVQRAVQARQGRGLPAPSLVLLITKADIIKEKNGSVGAALRRAAEQLHELVPVAYAPGVTTLICPVQIGKFGSAYSERVDTAAVDPVGVHRPLIFSLMHFLTEGVDAHQGELRRIQAARDAADSELAELRGRLLGGFFQKGRISHLERAAVEFDVDRRARERQMNVEGDRIQALAAQLANQYIVSDGKLLR